MTDYRAEHAVEAAHARRLASVREHEATLRRMADERWQRRILPLLARETPDEEFE